MEHRAPLRDEVSRNRRRAAVIDVAIPRGCGRRNPQQSQSHRGAVTPKTGESCSNRFKEIHQRCPSGGVQAEGTAEQNPSDPRASIREAKLNTHQVSRDISNHVKNITSYCKIGKCKFSGARLGVSKKSSTKMSHPEGDVLTDRKLFSIAGVICCSTP